MLSPSHVNAQFLTRAPLPGRFGKFESKVEFVIIFNVCIFNISIKRYILLNGTFLGGQY
jgi:hypothetical protein